MHSTTIFLLALGLLATVTMARPRPGHHHGGSENEISGHHGYGWSAYRLPDYIRLPRHLTEKLGQPRATFTAKKILDGKYLLISPALIFKLKDDDNDTETSTTPRPTASTTDESSIEETTTDESSIEDTTTSPIDEESTTTGPEEEESTTAESEEEESTTPTPSFFKKRSFAINNSEQLLFLDD